MRINSQELKAAIAAVKPALLSRSSVPVLQSVLISENKVTAYNLEVGIISTIDTYADSPFLLPPKAIDLIPKLPDDDISIEVGNTITIECGGIKTSYPIGDPDDYPEIDMDDMVSTPIVIDGDWFRNAIKATAYAVAKTDEKPVAKGILLDCKDGFLNIVGCNGYQLAWAKIECDSEFKFIVAPEALKSLLSMKEDVSIRYSLSQAIFECGDVSIVSRLISGEFMSYAQAIPQNPHTMFVDRKHLCDALDRIAILSDKKAALVVIQVEDGAMSLSLNESSARHIEEILARCTEPLRIGFNHKYLKEAFDRMRSEEIEIKYGGELTPFLLSGEDDAGLLTMVLAVRIRDES